MTSQKLVRLAHDLRSLDRDRVYAMYLSCQRQAARENDPEIAEVWGSFAAVLSDLYEETVAA